MDESIILETLTNFPENYTESVWAIEFADIDNQIDHHSEFNDFAYFDRHRIKNGLLEADNDDFNEFLDIFKEHRRTVLALIYRSFCLVHDKILTSSASSNNDQANVNRTVEEAFLSLSLYLRLIKDNQFYHSIIMQKSIKIFDNLFAYKKSCKRRK